MKTRLRNVQTVFVAGLLATALIGCATSYADSEGPTVAENKPILPEEKIARAVQVLDAQLAAPLEKRISAKLLENAQCVALIPDMAQAGLGVGFKHGNGLISCRHEAEGTWGAPAFIRLTGASVGAQLGVQVMDVMVLAMTDNGLNQLLAGKPIVGGEAGISVGPVGRNAELSLDVLLQTPLLSYTRSKGFYAGATLGGSVFTTAKKLNQEIYGDYEDAKTLLLEQRDVPSVMQPLVDALNNYAPN